MQLILVEDEESVSRFIKKGFVSEGYQIDVAFDGTIAKSLFEKKPYDLAILDINLPGLNGYQLCQHFKKINPYIPVIFLTALDSIDDKLQDLNPVPMTTWLSPLNSRNCCCGLKPSSEDPPMQATLRKSW